MKSLVFWGKGTAEVARALGAQGASFVLWRDAGERSLRESGVSYRGLRALVTTEDADRVDEAAIAWTKAWGQRPLLDGSSFRQLITWKGVSLWWFAELYLHHSTAATRHVRVIETFHHILELERPDEVEAFGLAPEERVLLGRTCTARGVLFHGPSVPPALRLALRTWFVVLQSRWNELKTLASALKTHLSGTALMPETDGRRTVLFLSHAAFWRSRRDPETGEMHEYEHYFDTLIPELANDAELRPAVVAVGPRAAFRRRRLVDRLREWVRLHPDARQWVHMNRHTSLDVARHVLRSGRKARDHWKRLRVSPGVHAAFSQRGVSFMDLSGPDLAGTLLLQLPWAVRSYEETAAALVAIQPAALCLYAESSGWGRAALAACRAAGVPTLAIQHGILYPTYYSYRHAPDEADCPRPDRTAVFGESARRLLTSLGAYAPGSLVVTGSPKFDALLAEARNWDREASRRRLGVQGDERLLVVASRFRGIRETHQSIGSAFGPLVRAVESRANLRCLVKPHPAEAATSYQDAISGERATRVSLAPAMDLAELLHAADALVTVESLSAVEALVLDRPVLVLNMPTNIRDLVEQGVALGVAVGEDPAAAIEAMLFDPSTRERLAAARRGYLVDLALGVDGQATRRILDLLRTLAGGEGRDAQPVGHDRV